MQKSNKAPGQNNEPIWFTKNDTKVTEINIGSHSPHKIMVCTPCHSDTCV